MISDNLGLSKYACLFSKLEGKHCAASGFEMLNRETERSFAPEESAQQHQRQSRKTHAMIFGTAARFPSRRCGVAARGAPAVGLALAGAPHGRSCPSAPPASPDSPGWGSPLHWEGGGCPPLRAQDPRSPCPGATWATPQCAGRARHRPRPHPPANSSAADRASAGAARVPGA